MNREEAKLKKDFCKDDMCRGLMDIVNEHINNIYDDFESRTCENCKYSVAEDYTETEDVYSCRNEDINLPIEQVFTKDFGCNKWGAKDD